MHRRLLHVMAKQTTHCLLASDWEVRAFQRGATQLNPLVWAVTVREM